MGPRSAERMMPPLTQTATEALWGRAFSSADASTSGRGSQPTSSRLDDDDVVVLLSDETAASEAAPLISHNAVKLAFCGGVSGALAKTCTAPLARLTILYQVRGLAVAGPRAGGQQMGVLAALRHITATEGIHALWKGNLVTIMHRIPYSATNFFMYETTKRALQGHLPNDSARAWAAGAASGLVACTAAYPLDLLRTRIAADTSPRCSSSSSSCNGSSSSTAGAGGLRSPAQPQAPRYRRLPALHRILSEQGVRGLYKGLGATLVQVVPGLAFNFCFYDTFKGLALRYQQQQQQELVVAPMHVSCHPTSPTLPQSRGHQHQHQHPHPQPQPQHQSRQLEPHPPAGSTRNCCSNSGSGGGGGASYGSREGSVVGVATTAVTVAPAAQQSSNCSSTEAASPPPSPSPLTSAVCACLSGLCTSSLTFPLDVVRRRLQVYESGTLGRMRYLDVVRAVYGEGGVAAFYRGLVPEFAKVLPGMAIAFTTYETMKRLTGAEGC